MQLDFDDGFKDEFIRLKNNDLRQKLIKQIEKLRRNPDAGKPMKYGRKGTRELYIHPFRLSYCCTKDRVIILGLYHKDEQ